MSSLTRRAILTIVVAQFVCALAISGTALWHERWTRFRAFDDMLQGRSDSLLGSIQDAEDPGDNVKIDPEELDLPRDDLYAVYSSSGRLLGSSPRALPSLAFSHGDGYRTLRIDGHEYRLLQREGLRVIDRDENGGAGLRRPVVTLYAARTDFIWHDIVSAARFYVLVSLLLLCATTAVLAVLLRRLLQPLRELAVAASAISARSLSFEPPASALRLREAKPLADALSATVTRLRDAFEMEHRFVGDASHELKTAVAVVRSSLQLLTMRPRSAEEYARGIEQVLNDNQRVEELVSTMLTLARFEERQTVDFVRVNLAESANSALRNLHSFAETHNVLLLASTEPEAYVWLTPERAEVLISNLVINAVQHSPAGATVRISLRRVAEPEGRAILEVEDSGQGIDRDKLPYVFQRFYRADPSRSRQTGGAGLGLAICKSIVDAVDGTIEMRSEPGHGTVVTATFRLA